MKRPNLLLNQFAGWRSALLDHVEIADGAALRLRRLPGAARALTGGDGSLGGFTNPVGLAVDGEGRVYVLDGGDGVVKRFDPCSQLFEVLPCLGGSGAGPRQLNDPRGMDISRQDDLVIADTGNRRIAIYSIKGLALRALLGPFVVERTPNGVVLKRSMAPIVPAVATDCDPGTSQPSGLWSPHDVAVDGAGWLHVADYSNGFIHVFDGQGCWRASYDGASNDSPALAKPIRLALDADCRTYVLQEGADHVVVLDAQGIFAANIREPEEVKGRFCPSAVAVDRQGRLHLTSCFAPGIVRYEETEGGDYGCVSQSAGPAPASADLVFDLNGNPLAINGTQIVQLTTDAMYEPEGTFVTDALDSGIYRCPWHRVVMQAAIGVGTQVSVETFTSEDPKSPAEVLSLPDERWTPGAVNSTVGHCDWDCLVQSPPGRYLWLRLKFHSDGQNTPCIDWLRLHFPRASSLQYLPAVYSEDPPSRGFLDQFLSIFDTLRDEVGDRVGRIAAYWDPMATPADPVRGGGTDFLTWLASWVGLSLDRHWPESRRRNLLKNAWKLYKLRGTPQGLRLHIQLYTGWEPQILEHFRLRRWMNTGSARLGDQSALWGADVVDRLQLDVHAQLDTVQLVDTGDPLTDPFSKEAHQFTVFVPLQGSGADPRAVVLQRMTLQRIIELSKPAHTLGALQLTQPRFRIGIQSFVGKDTIVGAYPHKVVSGEAKLGYDSALGQPPEEQGPPRMRVGKSTQIGTNTLLN